MMMSSLIVRPLLVTALLGFGSAWADLNMVSPDTAEARDDHGHNHASNSQAEEADPEAAAYYNQYYDPAYAQNYYQNYQDPNYQLGYRFSDYADDELVEKKRK